MLCCAQLAFQSTRPMRGATRTERDIQRRRGVSIHAPHAGRDRELRLDVVPQRRFNPRAPCGARLVTAMVMWSKTTFQSTRPMRGATQRFYHIDYRYAVSIHAPHAGRDGLELRRGVRIAVSIHVPHAGRD